jgi:hypothetical protein
MNNKHPITPPPELVEQWEAETACVAVKAARWGADQELNACCEWFQEFYKTESWVTHDLKHFRAARRPKPQSLKEQALAALKVIECEYVIGATTSTIRHALEALPND